MIPAASLCQRAKSGAIVRFLGATGVLALLSAPEAWALRLGALYVHSGAGEVMDGRIVLQDTGKLRARDILVALAPPEAFAVRGIERFDHLEDLRFQVVTGEAAAERFYVAVSSSMPIPVTYLRFVVEARWRSVALQREYVALLAPREGATRPSAPAPAVPQAGVRQTGGGAADVQEAPSPETGAREAPGSQADVRKTHSSDASPQAMGAGEVRVRPGQTLWSIAAAAKPPGDAGMQQYMLAILRENPQAFHGGNINGLIAGSTLRLPDADSAAAVAVPPEDAIHEAQSQNTAWLSGAVEGALSILTEEGDRVVARAVGAGADAEPVPAPVQGEAAPATEGAPEPSVSGLLEDLRGQVQEQLRRLEAQDGEIVKLVAELSALRVDLRGEREAWMAEVFLWRYVAVGFGVATLLLLMVAWWGARRNRPARAAAADGASAVSDAPPDYSFGDPIVDQRTKLNLAQANIGLGKLAVAKEILEEVLAEGDESSRQEARTLLNDIAGREAEQATD